MSRLSRRQFLENSMFAAAAAAATGGTQLLAQEASSGRAGPNDQLRVAVIGVNGQGMGHVNSYAGMRDVTVAAICDADEAVFAKAKQAVENRTGQAPVFYQDIRKLLEDPSIDAVSIATPNHWHALGAIWAIQAGKDVYVEKPVSHNVHEGRMIVEFARKHGKICQTGTQSRSNDGMRKTLDFLHSGKIGKVTLARGLCYKPRGSIGKVSPGARPPGSVDYDLWLGPAPYRQDVPRSRFHYDWHWQWDYGNGDLGNQGIHEMDKARWGLQKDELPRSIFSVGGRFGYEDDGQTANTQVCFFDYGDCQLIFEVRGLKTNDLLGARVGNIWYGSQGYVVSTNYNSGTAFDLQGNRIESFSGGGNHFANFTRACRSRKHSELNADILEGHLSSALCHLGNVSYQLGASQPLGTPPSAVAASKQAQETFGRFEEHLRENGVNPDTAQYRLGRELALDPKTERFIDDPQADTLLTRPYRKGFEVPQSV